MLPLTATLLLLGLQPAPLPPEIELDLHVLRARRQLAADQFGEAYRSLQRVRVLRAEYATESFFPCAQVSQYRRRQLL